jgi:hypothetical protein
MEKITSAVFYDALDELVQYLEKLMNETRRFYPNRGYAFDGHALYLLARGILEDSLLLEGVAFEDEKGTPRNHSLGEEATLLTKGLTEATDHYYLREGKEDFFAPDFSPERLNVEEKLSSICEKCKGIGNVIKLEDIDLKTSL